MRLGNIITDVALAGVQKVGQFFSDSIAEATEFQNVFAQTEAVIASTGAAAAFFPKSAIRLELVSTALSASPNFFFRSSTSALTPYLSSQYAEISALDKRPQLLFTHPLFSESSYN